MRPAAPQQQPNPNQTNNPQQQPPQASQAESACPSPLPLPPNPNNPENEMNTNTNSSNQDGVVVQHQNGESGSFNVIQVSLSRAQEPEIKLAILENQRIYARGSETLQRYDNGNTR